MPRDDTSSVVVTGVGLLSDLGVGFDAHRKALLGEAAVAPQVENQGRTRVIALARVAALEALGGVARHGRGLLVAGTTTGTIQESEQAYFAARGAGTDPLERMRRHPVGELAIALAAELDLDAECHTFVTACSSSSNAIGYGALRVAAGTPWALVGGVDTACLMTKAGFHALRLLASGPPRPFDVNRTGVALGEGAAFLLLESRAQALARGARIFGEVTGWGCAVDAFHQTAPDPKGLGAIAAMRAALEEDGAAVEDVGYINAHGTATPANDKVESLAVNALFGGSRPLISSTKGFTGHTLGAAGALEAGLTLAAFADRRVPPSKGLADPDPACDVNHVPPSGAPLASPLALSNSFGFGGNNATLALRANGSRAARARAVARPFRAFVHGLGFVAPGVIGCEALRRHGEGPYQGPVELPRQGRLARLERMALHAAREALGGTSSEGVGLLVGTAYGRLDAAGDFLEGLATRGEAHGSPFAFYQSVYHSLAGELSIHLGMRGIGLTTSVREVSGESALRVAMDLLSARKVERVLVVGADDEPTPGAAALLLSSEPSRQAVHSCELYRVTATEPSRRHPVGGLMEIVATLARGQSGNVTTRGTGGIEAQTFVTTSP